MTPRRRAPKVPSCPRCGNEEDLRTWIDGNVYCEKCLWCPHGILQLSSVCSDCVRRLHSVMTFDGPRITDIEYYIMEAWREYTVPVSFLYAWTFDEEQAINEVQDTFAAKENTLNWKACAPPPHHRF